MLTYQATSISTSCIIRSRWKNDTWIHILNEERRNHLTVPEAGVEGEGLRSSQGISVPVNWAHTQSRSTVRTNQEAYNAAMTSIQARYHAVLTGWTRGETSIWGYEGEFPSVLRNGRSYGGREDGGGQITDGGGGIEFKKLHFDTTSCMWDCGTATNLSRTKQCNNVFFCLMLATHGLQLKDRQLIVCGNVCAVAICNQEHILKYCSIYTQIQFSLTLLEFSHFVELYTSTQS